MRSINTLLNSILAATLLVAIAAPAFAQPAAPHSAAETTPSGAPHEGIKVHGDWTLTLRSPDGSVAGVHEFKNALVVDGGGRALAQLLGGTALVGQWVVHLYTTPANACGGTYGLCEISEGWYSSGASHSRDLTKSAAVSGPDAYKLVLRGSVRIPASATINMVQTMLTSCPSAGPPVSCISATGSVFSQRTLSPGVAVVADQLIEIKVVFSFS